MSASQPIAVSDSLPPRACPSPPRAGHAPPSACTPRSPTVGLLRLVALVLAAVLLWGWCFPAICKLPRVRVGIERLRDKGINPSAIFYTDVYEKSDLTSH